METDRHTADISRQRDSQCKINRSRKKGREADRERKRERELYVHIVADRETSKAVS